MFGKNNSSLVTEMHFIENMPDVPESIKKDLPYMLDSLDEYVINLDSEWHRFTRKEIEKRIADTTEHLQVMDKNWNENYNCITSWGCDTFLEVFGTEKCHERKDVGFIIVAATIRDELARRERLGKSHRFERRKHGTKKRRKR